MKSSPRCVECRKPLEFVPPYLSGVRKFLCRNHYGERHYESKHGRLWATDVPVAQPDEDNLTMLSEPK